MEGHDELNEEMDTVQNDVADLIERGSVGDVDEDSFTEELVAIMALMLLAAVNEGLGKPPDAPADDLPPEAATQYNEALEQTAESASNLWAEIEAGAFSESDERTAAQARQKAENRSNLWAASLADMYWVGVLGNVALERLRWDLGATERHCADCLRLDGQVHTRAAWATSGYRPKKGNLECGGWLCDCRFTPTDEAASGGF